VRVCFLQQLWDQKNIARITASLRLVCSRNTYSIVYSRDSAQYIKKAACVMSQLLFVFFAVEIHSPHTTSSAAVRSRRAFVGLSTAACGGVLRTTSALLLQSVSLCSSVFTPLIISHTAVFLIACEFLCLSLSEGIEWVVGR